MRNEFAVISNQRNYRDYPTIPVESTLGVLVVDEIQDLSESKSGGESHLMNFFVHLENSIGVPFILIGTPKALPLFKGEFRQARRASEQGDFLWKRLQMLSDADSSKPDAVWNEFVRQMWRYQYVKKVKSLPANILDESATKVLYNQSQGIIAVALTIFLLTQRRAIMSGVEEITSDVMKSAVRDNQNLISNMIDSIRLGQKKSTHGEIDFEPPVFRVNKSSNKFADSEPENGNGSSPSFKAVEDAEEVPLGENESSDTLPKKEAAGSPKKRSTSPVKNLKEKTTNSVKRKDSTDSLKSIGVDSYLKSPADLL